ncbi:MAG TPA: DNA repair protein RadC [Sphingobacteriaceae bacterium]
MPGFPPKITIKGWAQEDRPREKLLLHGRRSLTDAELIAILIGSGRPSVSAVDLSREILSQHQNDLDRLGRLTVKDLSEFKGIGSAKAIAIIAALELGRRRQETGIPVRYQVGNSSDVFRFLLPVFADLEHEEFWILFLNRGNKITGKERISKGGQAGTIADPKIIFNKAIEHHAASLILAHNHPSGNLRPSSADIALTGKLVSGGQLLDIGILDHLIITDKGYYSFADEGML